MTILGFLLMAAAEPAEKPNLLNTREILNAENYPFWARISNEEGRVRVAVDISPAGVATACRVIDSSGISSLDLGTCDILTSRGRFSPARDRRGRPVAGTLTRTVTWRLEQTDLWPTDDHEQKVIYSVDKNLDVSKCRVEQEPVEEFDPRTCAELRATAQMLVHISPPDFHWAEWEIVVETSGFAGAGDRAMNVGKREGEQLVDRDVTRMVIDTGGRITRCEIIVKSNMPIQNQPAWCERMMRTAIFVPAPPNQPDRLITAVTALYLRKSS